MPKSQVSKHGRDFGEAKERTAAVKGFIEGLRFTNSIKALQASKARVPCPKCGKRRQYYCYDCLAVTQPATHPDALKLPVAVHVLLHPGEHRSKATTIPAATVSADVKIHVYPAVPDLDEATTLLLYPSDSAIELDEVDNIADIANVIFVDSTWRQSKAICLDTKVTKYRHVKLKSFVTLFWRFQNTDTSHLATVEAIYYTVKRLVELRSADAKTYRGEADDLLFYYVNQYINIQSSYVEDAERSFTTRHFADYVLKDIDWKALVDKK
jgi:DTW domain-containing protein YfiP